MFSTLVIHRLRNFSLARRHPRPWVLSEYLDGALDTHARVVLETHLRECRRCRRELDRLADTLGGLGSLPAERPSGLADSIIAAVRAEVPPQTAATTHARSAEGLPALTVVPSPGPGPTASRGRILNRWPRGALAAIGWCLQRPQLRLTLPITLVAGVVLSFVNMGGMLIHGQIDLGVCISCTSDFVIPFLALNLALLMLVRLPRRRRL